MVTFIQHANTSRSIPAQPKERCHFAKQKLMIAISWCLMSFSFSQASLAEPIPRIPVPAQPTAAGTPTLDDLQNLKSEIVKLNGTFRKLEKDYLYPPSVDTALFVSVDTGQYFKLQNIEARIEGQPVAGHFYTDKQREALAKGGIQRLEEFQLIPGQYQLVITVIGETPQGETIKRGMTHSFEKSNKAIGLELQLKDSSNTLGVQLEMKTWQL